MNLYRWKYSKPVVYYKQVDGVWYVRHDGIIEWERSCNDPSWFRVNLVLIGNNYRQK